MGWLRDKIDTFVARYIDNFFLSTKWSAKQALKSCDTTACAEAIWAGLDEDEKADPQIAALYEDAKARGEQNKDLGIFGGFANAVYDGFGGLLDKTLEKIIPQISKDVMSDSPGLVEAFDPAIERVIDTVFSVLNYGGKTVSPELEKDIKEKLTPLIRLTVIFEISTWMAEWIQPMKNTGLRHVAHALHDTVGFKELSRAYIDPLQLNLVRTPVKYSINELTTPFVPRFGDAMEWYGRGHIDEDEFKELRAKNGIESKWDYRYYRMGTKPSSYFMLNAIAREGFWDVDDFKFWLSDAGYGAFKITKEWFSPYEKKYGLKEPSTSQIDFLLGAYKQMNLRSTVGDVRGIRRKLMLDGWITREDFEKELGKYKITKEDAKDVLDAIEEEQDVKDKKELQKAYEKKYLYGRIRKEELKKKLGDLGIREGRIKSRMAYLFARKEGKLDAEIEGKTLTRAQIVAAYKDGRKDKGWAVKQLDDMGYTIEDATLQAEEADQDVKNDTRDEWFRAFETRTLNGRMSIEELQRKYVELGKTEGWAEARAAYIQERLLGKEEEAA